jgi:DNA-binding XRE family transcriptional regulator
MSDGVASSMLTNVVPPPRRTSHAGLSGTLTAQEHVDGAGRASLGAAGRTVGEIAQSLSRPPGVGDVRNAADPVTTPAARGALRAPLEVCGAVPTPEGGLAASQADALLHLGAALVEVRQAHGLSQEKVAERVELDDEHRHQVRQLGIDCNLHAIERGGEDPSFLTIAAIACAIGVPVAETFSAFDRIRRC